MGTPSQRSAKALNNVIPLDPRAILHSSWFTKEQSRLNTGVDAHTQKEHGGNGQGRRGHFGHDGSKDLGGGVFTLPGHVFGHEEGGGSGGLFDFRCEGDLVDAGGSLGRGDECRRYGHNGGEEKKTELGHFCVFNCDRLRQEKNYEVSTMRRINESHLIKLSTLMRARRRDHYQRIHVLQLEGEASSSSLDRPSNQKLQVQATDRPIDGRYNPTLILPTMKPPTAAAR